MTKFMVFSLLLVLLQCASVCWGQPLLNKENDINVKALNLGLFTAPVLTDASCNDAEYGNFEVAALKSGRASYYGKRFQGRRTASGERFNMHLYTAAHRTLPFGSLVQVVNPKTGRSVVVRINDRGPHSKNRDLDLTHAAARHLGFLGVGCAQVQYALLSTNASVLAANHEPGTASTSFTALVEKPQYLKPVRKAKKS
jgi:rare lipoprotein A (peptidoglycan hydrolase)